ncbi:Urease [Naganishia adeliensis]|uniref:Urease n=1 Tax=Naganishia adeliensis TaxID=92952 RepID=A0ACC2V950_9TREE|nr:Urease [Naganishia adeliensis]
MRLLPREQASRHPAQGLTDVDKLLLANLGFLSQKRLARGLKLNRSEAIALIAFQLQEFIRDGKHSVADLMQLGKEMLGRRHVLHGVEHAIHDVLVEGTFPVSLMPISYALYGSFLPIPSEDLFPLPTRQITPAELAGAVVCLKDPIKINTGRRRWKVKVANEGDRPIQVGSHFPFLETNGSLSFNRFLAFHHTLRLDISAGSAVRFEPGERKTVTLVQTGGAKLVSGGSGIAIAARHRSPDDGEVIVRKMLEEGGFAVSGVGEEEEDTVDTEMDREVYASIYGPTTGDRVRLGDTSLWVQVENDYTVYGDECKFGEGKTLRDGQGQASDRSDAEVLDLIITNALIIDWSGICKADIGVKDGIIVGIGKGGNPDMMGGVLSARVRKLSLALASGITTVIGGGTGPSAGTNATTCTSSKFYMKTMMSATDGIPLNFGFTGKGNDSGARMQAQKDVVEAGAIGLKLHEDWGTTPETIDRALTVGDEYDVQINIHTDTLNESGFVESTIAAFKGRTIHTYHTEGAGGGHAPDIIVVCEHPNVLPSSTNPTRPYAKNTLDEHLDVCHHLDKSIPEDIAFADSRIRAETVAAEDVLHDTGAIAMMSSDAQAMGRIGEVITRTWRTASKMKDVRGPLEGDSEMCDNNRVKRYVAKYTVNPAICHGMSHLIGQVATGCLADLVVWKPENFGAKPEMIIKGGVIAWATMGEANASIPTVQPVYGRPMWAAQPSAAGLTSVVWSSKAAIENGTIASYGLKKRAEAVKNCRTITKRDMKHNNSLPKMSVDPETYEVKADGVLCDAPPATEVALSVSQFVF